MPAGSKSDAELGDAAGREAAPEVGDDFDKPSKTRLKQQAHALQALGRELAELPASRLAAIDLPEALRSAIAEYLRTKSHEGKRRQLQFVGKQMRFVDPAPLREAVDAYRLGSAKDTLSLHLAERWRDEMLAGDEAIGRWAAEHPASDLQRLRSLVRAARKDGSAPVGQRNGRSYRELFQFIKPLLAPDEEDGGQPIADGAQHDDD